MMLPFPEPTALHRPSSLKATDSTQFWKRSRVSRHRTLAGDTMDCASDRQISARRSERCDDIYREKASGKDIRNRPQLEKAIVQLGTGDVLVVGSIRDNASIWLRERD